jgi:hypothetical protein
MTVETVTTVLTVPQGIFARLGLELGDSLVDLLRRVRPRIPRSPDDD